MKNIVLIVSILMIIIPTNVFAARGCCSHHNGVCGCSKYGIQMCCDGTASKTCRCDPPKIYGCTDSSANNYNSEANMNDGSCTYTVRGCTDSNANNYNSNANEDDGSCKYDVYGCTNYSAKNYNPTANKDDGSCEYEEQKNYNVPNTKITQENNSPKNDYSLLGGIIELAVGCSGVAYYMAKRKNKSKI